MKVKPIISVILFLSAANYAAAQKTAGDTVLKGSTIEVIQSYKPQVKKAPKPEWMPQLPAADTTRPVLNFEVPQQTLYYSYTSEQLRPLALGKDTGAIPFPNYVKAGAGNLSTLYLDAGIGNVRGANYETAIHLHHESQKGSIQSQQTAFSGAEAEGVLRQGENKWHAFAAVERNQYFFYGYDHSLYTINSDSIKQTYTSVKAGVDLKRKITMSGKDIYCQPSVDLSLYDARFNTSETSFGFNAPFSHHVDSSLEVVVAFSAEFTHLKMTPGSINNNLAELLPGVVLHQGKLTGHGFLGFAVGKGGSVYVLPDIVADYLIPATTLTLSGGWQATVRRNTYEELTTENPYLNTYYAVRQMRSDELFANLKGSYGKHINYAVRASWLNFSNLPTYLNTPGDFQQLYVAYDDVSALRLKGTVRYTESSKWSAGATAEFYKYYTGTQAQVWHLPTFKMKVDLSVKPLPELTIMAYTGILGGIYAKNILGNAVLLDPIVDIGGNAEYQIIPRLSAFLQVSNLLNSKYQRWLGYQAYGLNVYGGIRLKF